MSIKILTNKNVEITHIDDARNYNFNAGLRSGIVEGAFNEGTLFNASANSISLDTCELRVYGFRIIVDEVWDKKFLDAPTENIRYKLVGTLNVDENATPTFDLNIYALDTILKEDKLFKNKNATGTYQVEIGRFTLNTNGEVVDIVRTIDVITGGTGKGGSGAINIGNVTTQTLDAGLEAEVDIEERYVEEENKTYTDFNFSVPKGDQGEQGIQGETGLERLYYKGVLEVDTIPTINSTEEIELSKLNREPIEDDSLLINAILHYDVTNDDYDRSFLISLHLDNSYVDETPPIFYRFIIDDVVETTGAIGRAGSQIKDIYTEEPIVEGDTTKTPVIMNLYTPDQDYGFRFNVVAKNGEQGIQGIQGIQGEQGVQGDKGETGLEALVLNKIIEREENPVVEESFITQKENFNRTPITNDTFIVVWNNTATNTSFLCFASISTVVADDPRVLCKLINVMKLTGEQGIQGIQGETGDSIELRVSGGYIQWKPTQSSSWTNLIATSDLTDLSNYALLTSGNTFNGNQIVMGASSGDVFVVKREGSAGQTVLANGTSYLESSDGKASYQTPTSITFDNENGVYTVNYPTKAGTFAILEDITGGIKSETFNNIPDLYNKIQSIPSGNILSLCLNVTTPISINEDGIQVSLSGVTSVSETTTLQTGKYYLEEKTNHSFYGRISTISILYLTIYSTDLIINITTSGTQNGSSALFKKAMYWNDHCDGFDFTLRYFE